MKKNKIFKIFTLLISFVLICTIGLTIGITSKKLSADVDRIVYEQYEDPDVVSIREISGQNRISLAENKRYSYEKRATNGSVIFKFGFENNRWDSDSAFQIYLMLDEASYSGDPWWNNGNCIWFKYGSDNTVMMKEQPDGSRAWSFSPALTDGNHDIEVGRIAIKEADGSFIGRYYCFIKVDGEINNECINTYDPSSLMNQFHITSSNDVNKLVDANWTGNKVEFYSNKELVKTIFTKEYKIEKPADPVVAGKEFKGWFDDLGNQWDFDKNEVNKDLTLTAAFVSSSSQEIDDETYFADDTYTPVLRFLVSSDTHIGQDSSIRNTRLAKEIEVAYSYANNSSTYNNLDAALYAGDLSDDGSPAALKSFKNIADDNFDYDETKLIVSMGNHEFRTYDSATREIKTFEEALGQKCDYHTVVNGFHFIALSPNLNEGYNFSASKVAWLEEQLEIAAADTPNKPIFVIQHEGIRGTVYGSEDWGMDELTDVLCKYPQVVDFSGHSHYPLADPRSIWQGTFTALGTGTLHYYELGINGYKNGGVFPIDKNGGWASGNGSVGSTGEFQIVEIDANNAMRVIVYDLNNDREITRYYMRDLLEDRKLTYSHTERAKAASLPYFDNVTLNATAEENTIKVEFNQATCTDIVESYRIELYKKNKLVQTEYALSDYFFYPMPEKIKISIPNLDENTEYKIKVYAVNVWNQESTTPIEATVKTGTITIYEDVVDEISLNDLYSVSGGKLLTTDTLNSYKPVYFIPSENNHYGSFKLTMQLLYVAEDFQICFDEEFNNDDLVWLNNDDKIWFVQGGSGPKFDPLKPGLHKMEYGRYHGVEGSTSYTYFYVKIDDVLIHTTKSTGTFTNNGYFSMNFGSCYAAGSRYYDISYNVPRTTTPTFKDGKDIELSTSFDDWANLGGAITFDSNLPSIETWLEDATGAVTNAKTFDGKFVLGTNGDFYHYEIKTNKFDLAPGVTGEEIITKVCFNASDWKVGNLDVVYYEKEEFEAYDEISMFDIDIPSDNGIYTLSTTETGLPYVGTSPTYSAVLKYYLVCDDISSPNSEFRSQLGTLWSYYCTLWLQPGNPMYGFFGFEYSTRPTDRCSLNLESHHIYLIETGTIRVKKGEWAGWNYTYLKVDGELMVAFYAPANECKSTNYTAAFKIVDGYSAADISLARNIEYIVDGKLYTTQLAISGANIYEPTTPVVEGKYFTGWYTEANGGERVDFTKKFISNDKKVKYYARFSDELCNVKFYLENDVEYLSQQVGKGGQVLEPVEPTKTGEYKYDFVKWVIKGTDNEFDFASEITGDVSIEAIFKEHEYRIVYKADGKDYDTKYYIESNPTVIIGNEPSVPSYSGANGYWDYAISSAERTNGDTYAIARYNGVNMTQSDEISLVKFNGKEIDIADELTRYYLSFANTEAQAKWLVDYPANGGHERQDITFTWTDTLGNSNYVVYFADNAEFKNAFVVRTNKTSLSDVGIFEPGKTYYWKVVGENTNKVSAVDTFKVLNTPVRWISAGTVYNTRDIGGWTTIDGKQVVYGKIYRGGQLKLDQAGELSYMNEYSHKVFDYLKIKTEIELRGECTHRDNQFNEFEKMIYVNGVGYEQIFAMNAGHTQNYRDVFTALADESNYPFYFHCSWGADRTGALGFFINGILGVPYEQLVQDYELTSLSYSGKRVRGSNGYKKMYDDLLEQYHDENDPTNFKLAMENYLINYVGVKKSEIEAIRRIMLVDASAASETHTVTFRIEGKDYNQFKVFDGKTISAVAPIYFEKFVTNWLKDGKEFDLSTPITEDIVLDANFENTIYEDYDVFTIRDIHSFDTNQFKEETLGQESWNCHEYIGLFDGFSSTGSRMFEFDYQIPNDKFTDGVHVEIGSHMWLFKSHVWLADASTIHVFTNGTQNPTTTLSYKFELGKTYHVQVGVVIPSNGKDAGKKILVLIINDEILLWTDSNADLTSGYSVGMAGLQGTLHSTENKMKVTFKSSTGELIETKEIQRGSLVTAIDAPEALENKKFIGWYDELGNMWDFEANKVLKNVTLFAKYGDVTVDALVLDDSDFEIVNNYQVKLGVKIGELEVPAVPNNLEFVGWFDGETKLTDSDVVTDSMNLICRFKVLHSEEPQEPEEPTKPQEPEEPQEENGCFGNVTSSISFIVLLSLLITFFSKKKRNSRI